MCPPRLCACPHHLSCVAPGVRAAPCSPYSWRLVTAYVWFRSDPDCEGHRCENGVYDPQQDDGDESADEDSCSEHSSSTSTSTNQKEGKYCDCCYCEFFGHGGVSVPGGEFLGGRHILGRRRGTATPCVEPQAQCEENRGTVRSRGSPCRLYSP